MQTEFVILDLGQIKQIIRQVQDVAGALDRDS